MSWPVAAGTYRITGMVNWSQGATGVSQNNGFAGPALTSHRVSNNWWQATQAAQQVNTREFSGASLGLGASPAFAATLAVEWIFTGTIVFSAAGTFSVVATADTNAHTYTIGAYSCADLSPVS